MAGHAQVDFGAVTQLQQQVWSKGDFAHVAPVVQFVAEQLVDTVDVLPDERVLDVACGSGNTALAAARCFARVTDLDFVPGLLEHGRARARVSTQRFRSIDHFLEFFHRWFGPTIAAFEQVGPDGEEALAADLKSVAAKYNRAGDRAAAIAAQYAQVVAIRV
jgi:cyclopropane fatty-acyl-phospholipid synthase-like methyltransferase